MGRASSAVLLFALRSPSWSPLSCSAWQPPISASSSFSFLRSRSLACAVLPSVVQESSILTAIYPSKWQIHTGGGQFRSCANRRCRQLLSSNTAAEQDHATSDHETHMKPSELVAKAEDEEESASSSLSLSSSSAKFAKPIRVVPDPLPILYVYDHCPFCVRVRVALGLKNVKHELHFLANDDVVTPTKLIGQKIAPIFQHRDFIMKESMDIIQHCEDLEEFGPTNVILPATGRTDLKEWQGSVQNLLRSMQRPRYVATGLLPEFQQLDSRHAFIANHPVPPYSKDEWKQMELPSKLNFYAECMAKDPAIDIEQLNIKLVELDDIIECPDHCSPGGVSLDDVDLFSRLRSITIVRGVVWPAKLRSYMDRMSELADVPLYDEMAL